MVRLLEVRYWKQSDATYILRQFNDRYEDSSSKDSAMRSVSSSSKIRLSVCLFVCMSVCDSVSLSVYLSQTHIALGLKQHFISQRCPQVKTVKIDQYKENMWW